MSKQQWLWAETDFVEIDYPTREHNPPKYLCFLDVRQAWVEFEEVTTPDDFDEFYLNHDGTTLGVVKAVKKEFGVTLKPRPDLGTIVFEIMDGV